MGLESFFGATRDLLGDLGEEIIWYYKFFPRSLQILINLPNYKNLLLSNYRQCITNYMTPTSGWQQYKHKLMLPVKTLKRLAVEFVYQY